MRHPASVLNIPAIPFSLQLMRSPGKIIKHFFYVMLILLSSTHFSNNDVRGVYAQNVNDYWITAKSGLRMKKKPNLNVRKTGVIPYGEKVLLTRISGKTITIDGVTGKWSCIDWQGRQGWVFGGFLSKTIPKTLGIDEDLFFGE